ncbi:MAG: Acetyl-CoA acetyltransferase-like protein [Conexibacter sp.]|nr:Acetyl-CoA acetyltransferase-like protein [Conexibacter sp.]
MSRNAAVVGIGEVPVGKFPDRQLLDIAITVAEQALEDGGVDRKEVDTLLMAPCFADPWFNTDLGFARLVDELGMRATVRLNAQVNAGGSTGAALLKVAVGLVESGQSETVLCLHAEKFTNLSGQEGFDFFAKAGIERDFEAPFGMAYNAIPGLTAERYMYETGTPIEQLAEVSVACREWASLHPNAMFRKPMTVEDVLASKVIASPLHALMLNMLGDGGSAFVVTTEDRARSLTETPVYVWGEGDVVSTYSFAQHDDITRMNWSVAGDRAFQQAGVTPEDIDVLEIYIAYPIFHLIIMEELGFCARGEAGALVAAGETRPGGSLPTSTNGDAMSYGHIGAGVGVATLVETCRQLMDKAGERQVPGASIALKTAAGGAYSNANVAILGREPR